MIVYLPFFKPPENVLRISNVNIRRPTDTEDEQMCTQRIFAFTGREWNAIRPNAPIKRLGYAVLETSNDKVPSPCYNALLHVLTRHDAYSMELKNCKPQSIFSRDFELPKVPIYKFSPSLVNKLKKGLPLLTKNKRFQISVLRWDASFARNEPIDTVLDCCSSLEAAFSLPNELRLRLAFSAYHTVKTNKKKAFNIVYEMYGKRNSFIHGGAIPDVSVEQQRNYIKIVADILCRFVELGKIPDGDTLNKKLLQMYE